MQYFLILIQSAVLIEEWWKQRTSLLRQHPKGRYSKITHSPDDDIRVVDDVEGGGEPVEDEDAVISEGEEVPGNQILYIKRECQVIKYI